MADLMLNDLHNPDKIIAVLHKNIGYITLNNNQGWQECPGSWELWELWEKLHDGRFLRVIRLLKKCVYCTYIDTKTSDVKKLAEA